MILEFWKVDIFQNRFFNDKMKSCKFIKIYVTYAPKFVLSEPLILKILIHEGRSLGMTGNGFASRARKGEQIISRLYNTKKGAHDLWM